MQPVARLRRLSRAHLAVALVGGCLVVAAWAGGLFDGRYGDVLFDALYAFNALVVVTAAGLLAAGWRLWGDLRLLLGSLAISFWFLGSFYWTSYVWLAGEVLAYPALDELAFQSFHLLVIVLVWHLLVETDVSVRRRSALVPASVAVVPTGFHALSVGVDPVTLAFGVFQLALSGIVGVLGVHLIASRTYGLLGVALVGFTVADVGFHLTTLVDDAPVVVFLDPLWFGSHALISFSLLRYAARGRLP